MIDVQRQIAILLSLSLFVFVMGCSGGTTPSEVGSPDASTTTGCQSNDDCSDGNCESGKCIPKVIPEEPAVVEKEPVAKESCLPGSLGCRCTPTDACFDGLRCDTGICQECSKGSVGCACKEKNQCETGLKCEGGLCSGCVGKDKCPCHGNNTCDIGHRCVLSSDA